MKKKIGILFIIITLSIVSMLPLLTKTNIWGHDTTFHIANIESLKDTMDDNFLPSNISSTIGNGFGYGTHNFYPILPHLSGAIIYKLGEPIHLSSFNALAITYTLITILSAFIIYKISIHITKNTLISLLSVIIFIFMPYRLGDIIVRGSLNEVFTFLFIPMIILALLEWIKDNKKKFLLLFIVGYTGLIYSHLVITLYTTIFLLSFIPFFYKNIFKKESVILFIKAITLVTFMSLPLLMSVLGHKTYGNYLVFQDNYLSGLNYVENFNNTVSDYIFPKSDYSWDVPMYINIVVLALLLTSTIIYLYKQKERKKSISFLFIFSLLAFIVSLSFFPWKYVPSFLYMIQFAWRTETMLVISLSILAPLCIMNLNKYKNTVSIICIVLVLITSIPLLQKLSTHTYLLESVERNSGMGHSKEYLPVNTYNNIDYFNTRSHDIIVTTGSADIKIEKKTTNKLIFNINNIENKIVIELPKLYYLGYKLSINNKNIPITESNNGFITAEVKERGSYTLEYKGTSVSLISNILAITGIAYFIYEMTKNNKTRKIKASIKSIGIK